MTEERLTEWYRRYAKELARDLALKFRMSEADGEDIVQELFLKFQKQMPEVDEQYVRFYLRSAARNSALNRIRNEATRDRHETGAIWPRPAMPADVALIRRESTADAKAKFRLGMEALSPITRECVLLRMRGKSSQETARLLDLTDNAVRTRLKEARKKLRAVVGELSDEWVDWGELGDDT
jgi:RNA polymerase sigma factor (sigma-70 family)